MKKLIKLFFGERDEAIRYILVGLVTSTVSLISFFTLTEYFEINYLISNLSAWGLTVLVSYFLDKFVVFKTPYTGLKALAKEFIRFIYSRLFSFTVDMLLMWVLVEFCGIYSGFVKLLNSAVVIVLNYVISKIMVFKS